MRILIGVQGTGNGHLTRARQLVKALCAKGIEVDVLLSGRGLDQWPDEPWLHDAQRYRGLTFITRDGRVDRWRTLRSLRPLCTLSELGSVCLDHYDLIITDYEPLCAWASRLSNTPCIGIGHQYAFEHQVPRPHDDPMGALVLRHFAPATTTLGLHWHPFGSAILPPMIDHKLKRYDASGYTLVYLPFEQTSAIIKLLKRHSSHRFQLFAPDTPATGERYGNVWCRRISTADFRESLLHADRVVCSTGFMLISEALHLGLPVLTRPVQGQYEQRANASALLALDIGTVCEAPLGGSELSAFLAGPDQVTPVRFPDVVSAIAGEIAQITTEDLKSPCALIDVDSLSTKLWHSVSTRHPSWASISGEPKRRPADNPLCTLGKAA